MSNQVYSSDSRKYQTYPGYNRYSLTDDRIVAYGDQDVMTGYTAELVMQAQSTSMSGSSLTILETGMYSVKVQIELTPQLTSLAADIDMLLTTTDSRNGIAMIDIKTAESADSAAAVTRAYDASYVGWLSAGDILQLRVKNKNIGLSSQIITVKKTSTRFLVSRIY